MDIILKKAYDLLYSPVLTPWNLVGNAKLDNYQYVNFSRNNDELICEMLCEVDNEQVLFNYFFDMHDKLMRAVMIQDKNITTLFDRNEEVEIIKNNIRKRYRKNTA